MASAAAEGLEVVAAAPACAGLLADEVAPALAGVAASGLPPDILLLLHGGGGGSIGVGAAPPAVSRARVASLAAALAARQGPGAGEVVGVLAGAGVMRGAVRPLEAFRSDGERELKALFHSSSSSSSSSSSCPFFLP